VDLALCSSNYPAPGAVVVLLNEGDGSFGAPSSYNLAAADPLDLFGADLDGDGDVDFAVAHNEPGSSHLSILENNGDGSFILAHTYAPAILGQDVYGADFDLDGDTDLVMTDGWGSADNVHVLMNTGTGAFGPGQVYSAGAHARQVVAADVEGDGDRDILVANASDASVTVLRNDGYGAFSDLASYALASNISSIHANDLNGDGYVDLAGGASSSIVVALNQGDGAFGEPAPYPVVGLAKTIVTGDFDGDGDIDVAAALSDEDQIWVGLNAGDGSLSGSIHPLGDYPWGLQSADFDGDGDLDLAASHYNLNAAGLVWNAAGSGVDDTPAGLRLARGQLAVYPNPSAAASRIVFRLPAGGCR
ncbi:MAG: hypothetical protein GF355_02495, partial [Candidatus Eisenbacteria bacterium]|nr:hypothetical protein [Candidatus Eisenbacteria bacterium]